MDVQFLDHYERELGYLRELAGAFSREFPALAGRLGMDSFQCSDPFVERLLEGFAFMAARVQRRLDAEYPQWTRSMFDTLFPHYGRPVPSVGIFQLQPAHDEGSLAAGYTIPRGSRLYSQPALNQHTGCRFETTMDLELWPVRVKQLSLIGRDSTSPVPIPSSMQRSSARSILYMVIETTASIPMNALALRNLRIHFRNTETGYLLYESLLAHCDQIAISSNPAADVEGSWLSDLTSGNLRIQSCGLDPSDCLLPGDHRVFTGYKLLQEYFLLPEKFLFAQLMGLDRFLPSTTGNQLHLLFSLNVAPAKQIERIGAEHVALHCVPAANVFKKRIDRVHLDHSQHEHHLVVDRSRPNDFEIWSIVEMGAHQNSSPDETTCLPIYATHSEKSHRTERGALHYAAQRRDRIVTDTGKVPGRPSSNRSGYLGTELFVSLTDSRSAQSRHDFQQLSATVMCTNRDLPLLAPDVGWRKAFQYEGAGPVSQVLCLTGPTPPRPPLSDADGQTAWRLISHLNANYTSLFNSKEEGAVSIRELLRLYCYPNDNAGMRQIDGILNISHQRVVQKLPMSGPATYGQGVEVELQCDESAFYGGSLFLLGNVIEQFLARFVCLNSFTQLRLVSKQRGTVYRWPPRIGTTPEL